MFSCNQNSKVAVIIVSIAIAVDGAGRRKLSLSPCPRLRSGARFLPFPNALLCPAPNPQHTLTAGSLKVLLMLVPFIKTVHQLPECMAAHPASLPETLPNVDVATRSPQPFPQAPSKAIKSVGWKTFWLGCGWF